MRGAIYLALSAAKAASVSPEVERATDELGRPGNPFAAAGISDGGIGWTAIRLDGADRTHRRQRRTRHRVLRHRVLRRLSNQAGRSGI